MNSGYFDSSDFIGGISLFKIIIFIVVFAVVGFGVFFICKVIKKRRSANDTVNVDSELTSDENLENVSTEQLIDDALNSGFDMSLNNENLQQGYQVPVFDFNQNNMASSPEMPVSNMYSEPAMPANDMANSTEMPVSNMYSEPAMPVNDIASSPEMPVSDMAEENTISSEKHTSLWSNNNINNN